MAVTSPLRLRIGTRASPLARWQSDWVADQLRQLGAEVEVVEITTQGDVQQTGPVAGLGLQGVFTKEIQAAVLAGRVDVAVHSLKDLPTEQVAGLVLAAVPLRKSPDDALLSNHATSLAELPVGARIGTGSLRRQAQLMQLRPDLQVAGIRGNVDTRIGKLDAGDYDAIVLACAGLERLDLAQRIVERLRPPQMLPAPGQGALALEAREEDGPIRTLLSQLDDLPSRQSTEAERMMLAELHGGCSAPIGAWGRIEQGQLTLDGLVATLDGKRMLRGTASGNPADASAVGQAVAEQLLAQGAAEIVATARTA